MRHVDVQFLAEGTHTYAHFKGRYQRDWWRTDEHVAKQDGNRKWNEELISVITSVVPYPKCSVIGLPVAFCLYL